MAKRRKKRTPEALEPAPTKKGMSREGWIRIFSLVGLTVAVLAVYRFFMTTPYFPYVMYGYMAVGALSLLGYVIYNRGFSRRGVTVEMLPTDWSDEQKEAFVADAARRMARSRWLLIVVFAFFFTFAFELVELYVIPTLSNVFGFSL